MTRFRCDVYNRCTADASLSAHFVVIGTVSLGVEHPAAELRSMLLQAILK